MTIANIKTTDHLLCPHCKVGVVGSLNHLYHNTLFNPTSTNPITRDYDEYKWYCKSCYRSVRFSVENTYDVMKLKLTSVVKYLEPQTHEYCHKIYILVETTNSNPPIRFVCDGVTFKDTPTCNITLDNINTERFHINENSILSNTIKCHGIWVKDEWDPSVFRYMAVWGEDDLPNHDKTAPGFGDELYLNWLELSKCTELLCGIIDNFVYINNVPKPNKESIIPFIENWIKTCAHDINQWVLLNNEIDKGEFYRGVLSQKNGVIELTIPDLISITYEGVDKYAITII